MVNKKFNNKGSTFTIVIIAMALFMTIMFIVSFQTNHQIKTSSRLYIDMQQKYLAESGVDKVIADISSSIESGIKNISTSYSYNEVSTYSNLQYSHEGHIPVDLKKNKINEIWSNFISNYIFNGLERISNDLLNMNLGNGGITLKNNLHEDIKQLAKEINNKIGSEGDVLISKLADYVNDNKITDRNDKGYQDRVNVIGSYIDKKIEEISNIQQKLNELYINSENKNENLTNAIDTTQNKFKDVKYYLEEIKCKLGIKMTGNTTTININIPNYKFPNESTYKLDGYETQELNIPVTINYTNGSISSVEPITVDNIISIGYKDNKEYKMSANITFNIGKENNTYRVISYKVNKWEKI